MRPWLVLNRFLILTDVGIDTLLRNDLIIIDDVRAPDSCDPPRSSALSGHPARIQAAFLPGGAVVGPDGARRGRLSPRHRPGQHPLRQPGPNATSGAPAWSPGGSGGPGI
jgi:hypothetical protein